MALAINEDDPCGAAAQLRAAYAAIVAGEKAETITFKAGAQGVERTVTYHGADAAALKRLIGEYEGKCAIKTGGRPRRFGLRAGGI